MNYFRSTSGLIPIYFRFTSGGLYVEMSDIVQHILDFFVREWKYVPVFVKNLPIRKNVRKWMFKSKHFLIFQVFLFLAWIKVRKLIQACISQKTPMMLVYQNKLGILIKNLTFSHFLVPFLTFFHFEKIIPLKEIIWHFFLFSRTFN